MRHVLCRFYTPLVIVPDPLSLVQETVYLRRQAYVADISSEGNFIWQLETPEKTFVLTVDTADELTAWTNDVEDQIGQLFENDISRQMTPAMDSKAIKE